MNSEDILKVKTIVADVLDINRSDISVDSFLSGDLGVDEFDLAEISMNIENEFNILILNEKGIETIGDLINLVEQSI